MTNGPVVSDGHFPAFYVVLVLLEYIPSIPPHSSYVIGICSQNTNYVAHYVVVFVVKLQIMSKCTLSWPLVKLSLLSAIKVQKTMT